MTEFYKPFIIKLENGLSDITDTIEFSENKNVPLCSLGYHYFYHRTKESMGITKNFESKNEFYYVVNPFEISILNYNDSLIELAKIYFNIDVNDKLNVSINDRLFFIIWEILFNFELVDNISNISAAILSADSNPILQSIINYRKKNNIYSPKDKYFNISDEDILINTKNIKNYKGKEDITDVKTINTFQKDIKKSNIYSNIIIADSGFDDEAEIYNIILSEILTALKVQEKNGNFILKIFETFTHTTLKLIYFISSFYEEIYIYKPYYSRQTVSEKFIILKKFKYDQHKDSSFLNEKCQMLENILNKKINNNYIYDIFTNIKLPKNYLNTFTFINIKLANSQQILINDIIKYIKDNNYFGDKYHLYRTNQIEITKWWVSSFFPPSSNLYDKNKEDLIKQLNTYKDSYNNECIKFTSSLITSLF